MSMNNFEQQNTNDTDTIASAIDFSSLYSAIQHDYERNNISNIIMQLLHMYRPKDGINAYERVLRKVQDLLEDCDFQKKQLLLSMIPSPNNIADHTIKEIFRTTTGFIKLNLQENTFQNIFDTKNIDRILDKVSSPKQDFLNDKDVSNFKSSLSDAFPFRGFSESEISMIPSHIKNADLLNHHLTDNSNNCLERNNKYQMSSYRQYLLNKKYCVPTRINMNKISESHLSQMGYQDTCSTKMCNKNEIIANLWQNKIPRQFNDIKYECKKDEDAFDKDKKSDISHMIIDVGQDTTMKQIIKNDIHKMDVCWEDQNIIINADDFLPTVRDRLKMSLNNFLQRVQEGIFVELLAFPHIRSHPQVSSLNMVYFTSKELKSGTPSKVLEQDFISNVLNSDSNSCLLLKQQNTDINVEKGQKELVGKTKQKAIIYDNGLQKKYNSQEFNKVTELQLQQNNLDYNAEKKAIIFECKEKNTEGSGHGCEMIESKLDNVNSDDNFQTRSMFQLAAHKKRYYDTLLSVQRAKVAISNSLASPSGHLTVYNDPYYSNYMYQHLLHQQRHLMARPQFSTCPANLSGLSSVHCDQYSWERSTCKYLLLKQLRLQRQVRRYRDVNKIIPEHGLLTACCCRLRLCMPKIKGKLYVQYNRGTSYMRKYDFYQHWSYIYTIFSWFVHSSSGWIHHYIEHMYPYSSIPNESDETKYCVRRKNLEEIVGKLKETERNNLN